MRRLVGNHFFTGPAMDADRDLVGHRAARQEERILRAQQLADAFAKPVDGGIFHLLFVAHLGFGHCLSHAGRRLGFGIAEKVDETVLHGAFGSPAPP